MKSKHYGKYIGFILAISCTILMSIKLNTNNDFITKDKPKVFIKSTEKAYLPNSNEALRDNVGQRQISNGTSEVQLLPVADVNSPILVTPL